MTRWTKVFSLAEIHEKISLYDEFGLTDIVILVTTSFEARTCCVTLADNGVNESDLVDERVLAWIKFVNRILDAYISSVRYIQENHLLQDHT